MGRLRKVICTGLILLALAACTANVQSTPTPAALFLPYLAKSPAVAIFDGLGVRRDITWLQRTFGGVGWEGAGLAEIHACQGDCPASHTATVLDAAGEPVAGYEVTWSWPDGSATCYTDERGVCGFAIGPGAYYTPPAGGPHAVTVGGSRLEGLGMLALTNHEHVDSVWVVR